MPNSPDYVLHEQKDRRKEIAKEIVALLAMHELSVNEATAILELTKTAIDNYAKVVPID